MVTARRAPCPAIIKVHSRESVPPPMSRLYRVPPPNQSLSWPPFTPAKEIFVGKMTSEEGQFGAL
ncbi:hypothetical protein NEUTE2DRAFT_62521 [Neurospora tetrasperma FGSC 2509]|nr:hypothetical protein NEUTE2DRAFT_62521 [Neurospora tetrasperma FGSC 2509]